MSKSISILDQDYIQWIKELSMTQVPVPTATEANFMNTDIFIV